ncbi:hypothetical protein E2320_003445 [Naja naja]|nr:hypothetical protein E2320_003445 [Naja naja]
MFGLNMKGLCVQLMKRTIPKNKFCVNSAFIYEQALPLSICNKECPLGHNLDDCFPCAEDQYPNKDKDNSDMHSMSEKIVLQCNEGSTILFYTTWMTVSFVQRINIQTRIRIVAFTKE